MSIFNDSNPKRGVYQAKLFFSLNHLSNNDKLTVTNIFFRR